MTVLRELMSWRTVRVLGLLAMATMAFGLLAGCGKKDEAAGDAAAPPADAPPTDDPGAAAPPPGVAPPPAEAMPPGAPPAPGDPAMGGAPGAPGLEVESGQPADEKAGFDLAKGKPLFPSKSNPFSPLDPPVKPPPPPKPTVQVVQTSRALVPIRPTIAPPEPAREDDDRVVVPPGLRTSGILWGPTVKAILQQGEESWVVRPGDSVTIQFNGPRPMTVVAIGPEGVTLRDPRTGQEHFAPLQGQ